MSGVIDLLLWTCENCIINTYHGSKYYLVTLHAFSLSLMHAYLATLHKYNTVNYEVNLHAEYNNTNGNHIQIYSECFNETGSQVRNLLISVTLISLH